MRFVAIDVETANADLASICQIGIVRFSGGQIEERYSKIINPEDVFEPMNVSIHGIRQADVLGSPKFPDIYPELVNYLSDEIVACHTHFDRIAIKQVVERYGLEPIQCNWIDTARVARRAWSQYAKSGYGLANISADLGIQFKHHDAGEDARAAGEILLHAIDHTGLSLSDWLSRIHKPIIERGPHETLAREGNPDGALFGEVVVFTGALSMPRREASDLAAAAGCKVTTGVTKNTTLLVVGDQDIRQLSGQEKSSKHRKAEKLISEGSSIRILQETDFCQLIGLD